MINKTQEIQNTKSLVQQTKEIFAVEIYYLKKFQIFFL